MESLVTRATSITFLGVGSATDFARGQTSLLYRGAARLLVDCGPQTPSTLAKQLSSVDELDAVYITHLHADHCFGLPSLLLWLRLAGRTRKLTLFAETGNLAQVRSLLDIGYKDAFLPNKCYPIEPVAMDTGTGYALGSVTLSIAKTAHNRPNFALRVDDGKSAVAFSGDGLCVAQTIALYEGCDTIVQECAYAERNHDAHMNVPRVIAMARAVKPRQLFLVHCLGEERAAIVTRIRSELGDAAQAPEAGTCVTLNSR